ncbi:cholecystokinin receptor type A-like [Mizuhopecten yessoensis]|uniref:Cholecystokinin receptor n=1 Tax=Mizuhopecten yessoensis TaxID=6573 RepID=A0A210Q917_MIZYE|nr:cholecystokinin receptor type A-like [Mizuhopecten yessoensis]XP_021364232.1 cholecystokinin receptor type A-like [Mizuhopecten yessoensis]XP_021364233.1 cholecystokinin receptor type A-like [Mizuhopecten yessoensis]OWF45179.1 Cholecystokinin receptor [Mizuhopecten yessoensis]
MFSDEISTTAILKDSTIFKPDDSATSHFTTTDVTNMDNYTTMWTSSVYNVTGADLNTLELEKFRDKYIPAVVYLAILCVVGSIGNAHAFLVYLYRYKTSNHKMFVVWLAAVDFVACSCSIPFEIMDARHSYTFTSISACKVFRFLNHFVTLCSGILLGVIAVERYRKACVPMGRQLTAKEAKYSCFITVIVSFVLSIPALIFYGPTSKPVDNFPELIGSDCTVSKLYKKTYFKMYSSFLLLLCTTVFVVCVVTYTFIGRVLYRQMKFRRASQTSSPKQRLNSLSSCRGGTISSDGGVTTTLKRDDNSVHVHEDESSYGQHNRKSLARSVSTVSAFKMSAKKMKIFDRSKQITLMFLVATAISYAGYLPHLVLVIIQGVSPASYDSIAASIGALSSILIRGYFLSNVTNPLVYCFLDDRFRRECRKMYCQLKHCFDPNRRFH